MSDEIVSVMSQSESDIVLVPGASVPFHPKYFERRQARGFYQLSYEGGYKYKNGKDASGEPVFQKHECESDTGVKRRKALSTYRNYCKPIVNKYNDFVFTSPIKRCSDNKTFDTWSKNVDTFGTSLHEFMRMRSRCAAVQSVQYVLMETNKDQPEATKAQAEAKGFKPYLVVVDNDLVINETRRDGVLTQALIAWPSKGDNGEVWLYDNKYIYKATLNPKDRSKIDSVYEVVAHGYKSIPIVDIRANAECDSQIADIAECNKSLFNADAILREEISRQTFTQWMLIGVSKEDLEEAEQAIAGRKFWCFNRQDVKAQQLGSDTSQAASIRETISGDIKEIYRLAGLQNPDVVQGTESGRALKLRWNDVAITAASIADAAEHGENRIIKLWMDAMGGAQQVDPSDYPEQFDVEEIGNTLQMTLDMLGSDLPWVLKETQVRTFSAQAYPKMTLEDQKRLSEELDAMEENEEKKRGEIDELNADPNSDEDEEESDDEEKDDQED